MRPSAPAPRSRLALRLAACLLPALLVALPARAAADLSPPALLAASVADGELLLGQQLPDGSFPASSRTQQGDPAIAAPLLFQTGTCYALFELYGASGDRRFLDAGDRGVAWLESRLRGPETADQDFLALESTPGAARLDDTALLLLALLKHHEVTGEGAELPKLRQLARFLAFLQKPSGELRTVYRYGSASSRPPAFNAEPGEALLALVRLAQLDPAGPWLTRARQGANWLIAVRDLGKSVDQLPHDPWLLMALNELHAMDPGTSRRYFLHGRRMATGILRAQPGAGEPDAALALTAMVQLAERGGDDPRPYREGLEHQLSLDLQRQLRLEVVRFQLSSLLALRALELAAP